MATTKKPVAIFKELKPIRAIIGVTILTALTGCACYRWQGDALDAAMFDTKPTKKYCIENITFNSDVDIDTCEMSSYCKPWYFPKKTSDKEYLSELMRLAPEVFSEDPSAERISVNFKLVSASQHFQWFPFMITLGTIWPMRGISNTEMEASITSFKEDKNVSRIAFKDELWVGEPWTLAVHFGFPDRDDSLSETVTGRRGVDALKVKRAQQKVLAKAIIKLLK